MQKAKYAYRCVSRSFNCIFYSNFSNSYRKPSVLIDVPKRNFSQSSNSNNTPIDDEPGCDESSANNLESESNPNISQETPKKGVLVKSTVPDYFPELLAIPVGRRPIFPGFYKTITIYNTDVAKAVINTFKKGQPFIGLFMSKSITDPIIMRDLNNNQKKILDANPDEHHSEIIKSLDEIQKVGVLAQIVNIIPGLKINEDGVESIHNGSLTAIVFPHRRIRATCLLSKDIIQDPHSSTGKSDDTKPTINEPNDSLSICTSKKTYASRVMTENIVDLKYDRKDVAIRAVIQEIFATLADVAKLNPFFREHISQHNAPIDVFSSPSKLADFVAIMSAEEGDTLQEILEETNVEEKMRKALVVLKRELVAAQLQHSIGKDVELKMTQKQREYFLHEQLKVIKKELGLETDSKEKIIYVLREKESVLEMPTLIKSAFEEEINKLSVLEPSSSEFGVTRAYLEWLTGIPWGKKNTECLDIERAKKILDEDHYGMKDVKDRILEFMAVSQLLKKYNSNKKSIENAESSPLSSNHRGKILLLVGPPGVGKTSIGKSVANALGREYFRFSVGGLSDVAEIKGHRRTYVGAMPGKIVQALKQVKTLNPLIMIDEIDKLGRGNQGDPASALLEILDPEQNCSFLDHYIDLPIDLSDVLFICTANQLESISGPLIDRMEVISLSGYVSEEKIHIANKYLIPQALKDAGIDDSAVSLTEDSVKALIKQYCRESGVRNLKKHIEKIFRKAALRIVNQNMEYKTKIKCENSQNLVVQNSDESILTNKLESTSDLDKIIIQPENLKELIGVAPFISDRLYDQDLLPPGVVTGLAWTAMGGSILYIETIAHNARLGPSFSKSQSSTEVEDAKELEKQPSLIRTGQMGDVMKESTHIAYSFSKSFMAQNYPNNSFLRNNSLHLHVPEGATPKDGPSAGSTMATSLISLALNIQIPSNVAMTGELSLTGKILRIGGVKEKTIAARRSGINTIILPKTNEADWVELPDYIRSNLDAKFVNTFDEIAKILKLA